MPFNLLILPLVGGYFFLITSRFFKYRHLLIERQRLLFNSVLAGIVFLTLSFIIVFLSNQYLNKELLKLTKTLLPLDIPYTGTAILSLILSISLAFCSNLFKKEVDAIKVAVEAKGSDLEKLYFNAVVNGELLSITLENGKVYVGIPMSIASPNKLSYLTIFPMLSGYRNERQEIIFTTEYLKVYDELRINNEEEGTNAKITEAKFLLVLPTHRIISANQFDIDIYEKFKAE